MGGLHRYTTKITIVSRVPSCFLRRKGLLDITDYSDVPLESYLKPTRHVLMSYGPRGSKFGSVNRGRMFDFTWNFDTLIATVGCLLSVKYAYGRHVFFKFFVPFLCHATQGGGCPMEEQPNKWWNRPFLSTLSPISTFPALRKTSTCFIWNLPSVTLCHAYMCVCI